jgi:hypothetical protein
MTTEQITEELELREMLGSWRPWYVVGCSAKEEENGNCDGNEGDGNSNDAEENPFLMEGLRWMADLGEM